MLEVVLKDLLEVVLEDVGSGAIESARSGAGRCWMWCSGKLEAKGFVTITFIVPLCLPKYPPSHPHFIQILYV